MPIAPHADHLLAHRNLRDMGRLLGRLGRAQFVHARGGLVDGHGDRLDVASSGDDRHGLDQRQFEIVVRRNRDEITVVIDHDAAVFAHLRIFEHEIVADNAAEADHRESRRLVALHHHELHQFALVGRNQRKGKVGRQAREREGLVAFFAFDHDRAGGGHRQSNGGQKGQLQLLHGFLPVSYTPVIQPCG